MVHTYKESEVVKNRLVKKIGELKYIKCKCFVFDKNKIKEKDLYTYGLNFISKYFYRHMINNIIIAKRDTRSYYNDEIISMFNKFNLDTYFSYPNVEKSLQIADFYSWSIFSHLEYGLSKYFLKLKASIEIIDKTKPSRH